MVKAKDKIDEWALPRRKAITIEVVDRAITAEDTASASGEHHARKAWFDQERDIVAMLLTDGRLIGAERHLVPSLSEATSKQLRTLSVTADGVFLFIKDLDLYINVDGLVTRLILESPVTVRRAAGHLAGSSTSPAKAASSARNGQLGGRPRKHASA